MRGRRGAALQSCYMSRAREGRTESQWVEKEGVGWVTGSSEALLSGQKPKFRIVARAVDKTTKKRVNCISLCVSEEFVVRPVLSQFGSVAFMWRATGCLTRMYSLAQPFRSARLDLSCRTVLRFLVLWVAIPSSGVPSRAHPPRLVSIGLKTFAAALLFAWFFIESWLFPSQFLGAGLHR